MIPKLGCHRDVIGWLSHVPVRLVGVAVVLALRAIAGNVSLDEVPLDTGDHSAEERALLSEYGREDAASPGAPAAGGTG